MRTVIVRCSMGIGDGRTFGQLRGLLGRDLTAEPRLIDPVDRPSPENGDLLDAFCRTLGV